MWVCARFRKRREDACVLTVEQTRSVVSWWCMCELGAHALSQVVGPWWHYFRTKSEDISSLTMTAVYSPFSILCFNERYFFSFQTLDQENKKDAKLKFFSKLVLSGCLFAWWHNLCFILNITHYQSILTVLATGGEDWVEISNSFKFSL